jgi:hypothetical protein
VAVQGRAEPAQLQPAGLGLPVAEATVTVATTWAVDSEEEEESAIFLREANTERLVTVIEILSYSNKTSGSEKRAHYLLKRRELLQSGIHLVEVDLLRWGQRVVPSLPNQPYHILVSRADEQPYSQVWSFDLTGQIPTAPIPLLEKGEHVPLPLQAAYTTIYAARGFRQRLDYHSDPEGPLTETQRAYIRAQLATEGLRES